MSLLPPGDSQWGDVTWEDDGDGDEEPRESALPTEPAAEAGRAAAQATPEPHPEMARVGASKRKSLQEIKDCCSVDEVADGLRSTDGTLCSRNACPNKRACAALLGATLTLACIGIRQEAFAGPRQPGLAGASDARADLAFNVLRGSYAPMLEHGTFQFKVEQQPICEGVARWLRGFHFGAQWDSQKERVMGGCTSARDENGQGSGLGKRARGGKMGVAPSEKCYKSGHIVAWLENLASLIGDHMPGGDQRHCDVLVLPFRRWAEVHSRYNQACEMVPGFAHFQASSPVFGCPPAMKTETVTVVVGVGSVTTSIS